MAKFTEPPEPGLAPPFVAFSPVKSYLWQFSKVFNQLTSFNIKVGWYVHMISYIFLIVMNQFLVIRVILSHSTRRRPDKRTMPRQRWKCAAEIQTQLLGCSPRIGFRYVCIYIYIHVCVYLDVHTDMCIHICVTHMYQ